MARDAKHELVEFLVREAFDPVMQAKPAGRSEPEQRMLAEVQQATEKEVLRYRHYRSADEVFTNFRRDLTSTPAKKVHDKLHTLKLPTLHDVRDRFEEHAKSLGVGPAE